MQSNLVFIFLYGDCFIKRLLKATPLGGHYNAFKLPALSSFMLVLNLFDHPYIFV